MRDAVAEYMKDRLKNVICGYDWTPVKDGRYTYYFMNGLMFAPEFGKTNDYKTSEVRKKLLASDLLVELKEYFGDKLAPISLDLTSMDGFKDYGKLEKDLLAIPNVELMMKFRNELPLMDKWCWLSTPNFTPSCCGCGFSYVQCVNTNGSIDCGSCDWPTRGVRPFFILKSDVLVSLGEPTE